MTHYRSGWRKIAVIVLLCSAVVAGAAWFIHKYFALEFDAVIARIRPVPTTQQIELRRLRKIAGWFSRDCGHVPRHGDADSAIACAKDALKSGERFYVSFDYVGVDSRGTTGVAADSRHNVYEVVTDELGSGAFGTIGTSGRVLNVTVTPCNTSPIEFSGYPANRLLTCRPE